MNQSNSNEVFLHGEIWIRRGMKEKFLEFRKISLPIIFSVPAELVFYGHPFQSCNDSGDEQPPDGIEIYKFQSLSDAETVVAGLEKPDIKKLRDEVFHRTNLYLSRSSAREPV